MNDKLERELIDAGFPPGECTCETTESNPEAVCKNTWNRKRCNPPTLSELIEACGDDIRYLLRDNEGNWEAAEGVLIGKQVGHHLSVSAGTPEEAVAHLWLELNKKKDL